ncbi:sulfatase/phosphatase domain-containing protein [Negadavirga shengliensis]|uniref:Sulfatase/phosphatase domain-containing protein n=1 Tax=Negadavirga shengliensis TaxID=1389218 RepID=A0ABV9T1Z9_9BACT
MLIRYPEKIKPGSVSTEPVQNLDFAPTFLHYAEVPIPEDMQGESLHPLLENGSVDDWRTALYYHYYEYPAFHMFIIVP